MCWRLTKSGGYWSSPNTRKVLSLYYPSRQIICYNGSMHNRCSHLYNEIRRYISWQIKNKGRCRKRRLNRTNKRKKLKKKRKPLRQVQILSLSRKNSGHYTTSAGAASLCSSHSPLLSSEVV